MPLDQYKTQILLLHSEQSTLDSLSSGFSDNYTVHCATSGSEALNTLVETPINVIVTAQDLPGMSGLDALREAKKRSPDTIGILLTGNSSNDVQALVGDEEVFQIVSGNVSSDAVIKLVENATRQMRLMALAGAANDTVASVDEPAEHIVMETSENGSTIISGGIGRMPSLDPQKVAAAASVGSRSVDILVLTKDQEFLATIKDSSRGMHKVYYANTLAQANEAISKHKIGVAVVDAAMVGDKIEQLTQHLRKGSERLVSIVAGRRDDGEMLMDLINRGKVYRFLLKPVSPGRARLAVEASVKHHLEAPDAAFKIGAGGAAAAAKAAATKPAPVAASRPAPKPEAKAAPKPAKQPPQSVLAKKPEPSEPTPVDPPLGAEFGPEGGSPIEDGLADAFSNDNSSFSETVTGLISSVGRKFSSSDEADESKPPKLTATTDVAMDESPMLQLDSAGSGSGGSILKDPRVLGMAAAAVLVVAISMFWFFGRSETTNYPVEENLATPSFAEADVVFDEPPRVEPGTNVDALLDEARLARDAGQLFNPVGSNAIELFAEAQSGDPENAVIAAELDASINQALSMAETAMLESRTDDADAALQRVAMVDPDNARLPFLTAQISQMQLRGRLDEARVALREDRFEDAANALNAARSVDVADSSEIDAVAAELRDARGQQQVDEVLAKAAERLNSGALLSPANDNARYYYQLVLSADGENAAARQGLTVIAGKLVFQARTEIDSGNLNAAEDFLADARAIDPSNPEVATSTTALANARATIAERERRAEAERQAQVARDAAAAEAERIAEAERLAELQAEADRQAAAENLLTEGQEFVDNSSDTDSPVASDVAVGLSVPVIEKPGTTGSDIANSIAGIDARSVDNRPAPVVTRIQSPIAVSSLDRVRYVAPKYPRSAQRRNQSGWVDVVFTVGMDGAVKNVEVRNSEPGQVFVNAAVKAVEKWEFEPVVENGVITEKRAGVRMLFALE